MKLFSFIDHQYKSANGITCESSNRKHLPFLVTLQINFFRVFAKSFVVKSIVIFFLQIS